MNLNQVLSFLENEEKRNQLIKKLKNAGENSKQSHALKDIITSFNLYKTPKEILQKNILQTTFRCCFATDCFEVFRYVCKSWKRAVETMQFKQGVGISAWVLDREQNGKFAIFLPKYLKMFKLLTLEISPEILLKWSSVSELILQNMKNLKQVKFVVGNTIPPNFEDFLFQLFKKSQNTITTIRFLGEKLLPFPDVSLPYVEAIGLKVTENYDIQIENFDKFMMSVVKNCEYLEEIFVHGIQKSQQVANYIAENYPRHCVYSDSCTRTSTLPMQVTYCRNLSYLSRITNPYGIKALYLKTNYSLPFENRWDDHKIIFQLFPNLKSIYLEHDIDDTQSFNEVMKTISSENQNIWKERVAYLKSQRIEMINCNQMQEKIIEFEKCSGWGFTFQSE